MFRKYVIITLATVFFVGSTSCTSKKASDDGADVEASADDESLESAEATENNEDLDSGDGEAIADAGGGGGDELAADEQLPDDSAGGGDLVAENTEDLAPGDLAETPPADLAANDAPPPDMGSDAPAADMGGDAPPADMAASEPPAPEVAPTPEPSGITGDDAPKPVMSLKKIASQPYKQGKILVNAVYLVRAGDTPESISQKVFASKDHAKELCKVNAYNCQRGLKTGDKMYYNSPQRPNDDTVVKTFYEDAGVQPQMYSAKQGDNIRKVGKDLLGEDRSWMELWATNEVESKGDLDEGTQLKYWPSSEIAAPALAATDAAPADAGAPPAGDMPPQDMAAATPPDAGQPMDQAAAPPAEDLAMNNPPPPQDPQAGQEQLPPAPDANAMGSVEPPPPPPPPPSNDSAQQAGSDMAAADDPNQQNFMLGVGAVLLLAAAALFISIRKKRARRQIDFNTSTQTQIE